MEIKPITSKDDPRIAVLHEDLEAVAILANQMGLTPIFIIINTLRATMMLSTDSITGFAKVAAEYAQKELEKFDKQTGVK